MSSGENMSKEDTVAFVCPMLDNLSVSVDIGNQRKQLKFEHHKLTCSKAEGDALEEVLSQNSTLAAKVIKLDVAAAEKFAKEHMAKTRPQAHAGTMGSDVAKARQESTIDRMRREGASEESIAKMTADLEQEGLELTESTGAADAVTPEKVGLKLGAKS